MQIKCKAELAALQGAVRRVVADILAEPNSPFAMQLVHICRGSM